MTESLASVSAIGSPRTGSSAASTSATTFGSLADASESGGSADGLREAFRSTLETFQSAGSRFEATGRAGSAFDPVAQAKTDLLGAAPSDASVVVGAQQPTPAVAAGESDGTAMLKRSFDHALFVSLVSQIVSGASQATSTLIKQQ